MFSHILIATDGSELAGRGVSQGLDLASKMGAKVTVITVTEPLSATAFAQAAQAGVENPLNAYERQMDDHAQSITAPIEKKAAEMGVSLTVIRDTDAHPAEAIVRTAKLNGVDLIVMSSHGRRGLSKILLGSQTSEVLVHTTIPVLVIR